MRKRTRFILLGVFLLLLAAGAFLFWPAPPLTGGPYPTPNGCDDFAKAAALLVPQSPGSVTYREMTEAELRQLVSGNAGPLQIMRDGFTHECRVKVEYSASFSSEFMATVSGNKSLAQALMAECRYAEIEHRTNAAATSSGYHPHRRSQPSGSRPRLRHTIAGSSAAPTVRYRMSYTVNRLIQPHYSGTQLLPMTLGDITVARDR